MLVGGNFSEHFLLIRRDSQRGDRVQKRFISQKVTKGKVNVTLSKGERRRGEIKRSH